MTIAPLRVEPEVPFGVASTADLVRDDRVHRTLYTSPEVFAEELEKIWYRAWVYVGHESEIPSPGDYVSRSIGLQPVLLVRGSDGEVRVLVNRCTHRGNTVCPYAEGNAQTFRCEYHRWTFKNTGELAGVTFPNGMGPDFDRSEFALGRVPRVDQYRGFVFGSFASEGPSLEDHLGNARWYIDDFVDLAPNRRLRLDGGRLQTRFRGNWKMAAENSVDAYHAPFLHRSFFTAFKRDSHDPGESYGENSIIKSRGLGNGHAMVDFSAENRKAGGKSASYPNVKIGADQVAAAWSEYREGLVRSVGEERTEELLLNGVSILYVFPNLALNATDLRFLTPVAHDETIITQAPALLDGAPRLVNQARVRFEDMSYGPAGMIGTDDLEVYERSQLALVARTSDWVNVRRGMHREELAPDGTILGQASDEITLRSFWRQYRDLIEVDL